MKKIYIVLALIIMVICVSNMGMAFNTDSLDSHICDICNKPLRVYSSESVVYEGYYITVGDFGFALCIDCYEKHKKEIDMWADRAKKFVKREQDKIDKSEKTNKIKREIKRLQTLLNKEKSK